MVSSKTEHQLSLWPAASLQWVSGAGERPQQGELTPTGGAGRAASLSPFCEFKSSASSQGKGTGPGGVGSRSSGLCAAIPTPRAAFLCHCFKVPSRCRDLRQFFCTSTKIFDSFLSAAIYRTFSASFLQSWPHFLPFLRPTSSRIQLKTKAHRETGNALFSISGGVSGVIMNSESPPMATYSLGKKCLPLI